MGYAERLEGRLRVLEQDHRGCAAARNLGAGVASGEYLAFLDSDDLWFPWTLRIAREAIEQNDRPTMVAMTLHTFKDPSEVAAVEESPADLKVGRDFLSDALRFGFALGVAHTVCKREAYERAGGCVEKNVNGTDSDVLLRMGVEPGFVRVIRPPLLAYRQHEGAVTTNPEKGFAGMSMLVENERSGVYPGGAELRGQRLDQILIRVRAVSVRLVNVGRLDLAWRLYRKTFWDQVRRGRWRYLLAFPLLPLRVWLLGPWRGRPQPNA